MVQVIQEWSESYQGGESPRAEIGVSVLDAADLASAVASAIAGSPAVFCGLVQVDHRMELKSLKPQTRHSGTITYGERKRPETGEYEYEFRTSGGQQHVTVSKATIDTYVAAGVVAPNTHQLIGINEDGEAEGTSIHWPVFEWSETWYVAHSKMSDAYIEKLFELTGKVNSSEFKITPWSTTKAPAGEVLFLGSEGKIRVQTVDWAISFHFARSKNAQNIQTGPITVATKKGWDYVWYHRRFIKDGNFRVPTPTYAKVERLYDTADLNGLFPTGYR